MAIASRLGDPVPGHIDLRGEGVVDFSKDWVWTTNQFLTERMMIERKAKGGLVGRIFNPLSYAVLNRITGREVFYAGGSRWKKTRKGWSGPSGLGDDPKTTQHPLFLLDVISSMTDDALGHGAADEVRGTHTSRFDFRLDQTMIDRATWEVLSKVETRGMKRQVAANVTPRDHIGAVLWLDRDHCIRRLSYEAVYNQANATALWLITEFWNFGVPFECDSPFREH